MRPSEHPVQGRQTTQDVFSHCTLDAQACYRGLSIVVLLGDGRLEQIIIDLPLEGQVGSNGHWGLRTPCGDLHCSNLGDPSTAKAAMMRSHVRLFLTALIFVPALLHGTAMTCAQVSWVCIVRDIGQAQLFRPPALTGGTWPTHHGDHFVLMGKFGQHGKSRAYIPPHGTI